MSTHSYTCSVFVRGAGVGWVEGTKSISPVVTAHELLCLPPTINNNLFQTDALSSTVFKVFFFNFLFQQ